MPDEKFDEKEREKQEEKTAEKTWEEKYRRDPVSAIVWAIILIWAGLAFLADNLGFLGGLDGWSVFFLGAGVILLLEVLVRQFRPEYRQEVGGNLFLAAIFLGIGLGNIFGWEITWPLILIGLGIIILFRGFWRRRE